MFEGLDDSFRARSNILAGGNAMLFAGRAGLTHLSAFAESAEARKRRLERGFFKPRVLLRQRLLCLPLSWRRGLGKLRSDLCFRV